MRRLVITAAVLSTLIGFVGYIGQSAYAKKPHFITCRTMSVPENFGSMTTSPGSISHCSGKTGKSGTLILDPFTTPSSGTITWSNARTTSFTWTSQTLGDTTGCPVSEFVGKVAISGNVTSDTTRSATAGEAFRSTWCVEALGGMGGWVLPAHGKFKL